MADRDRQLSRIRAAVPRFLMGEIGAADLISIEWGTLVEDGPLDGLLLELFEASEAWEPPGPTRVAATEELRKVAARIEAEGIS